MRKPRGLLRLQVEARKHEGECLSPTYRGWKETYKFRCQHGHIWQMKPVSIRNGRWCLACHHESLKLGLKKIQEMAGSRGGRCLSKTYVNAKTKMKFTCRNLHVFSLDAASLRIGNWCRLCTADASRLTIAEMQALARARGGECLSTRYVDTHTKLLWRCADGHKWLTTPASIKNSGSWCPKCAREKPEATLRVRAFRRLKERVRERGGKCLSPTYVGHRVAMTFLCDKGHLWVTKPRNILAGNWCVTCVHTLKFGLERMQTLAREKGGRCLSTAYVHSQTKMRFTCAHGHTFRLSPACLSRGVWCGRCAQLARRLTLAQMQAIAQARGGECLSTKYVNSLRHLLWLCVDGHMWRAMPNTVKNKKTWCPQCKNGRTRAGERRDWIAKKKTATPYAFTDRPSALRAR